MAVFEQPFFIFAKQFFCLDVMKKFSVLALLFAMPLLAYLFFASGVSNFGKLPKLTKNVAALNGFTSLDGTPVKFENEISVLGFFGDQVKEMHGHAFNINWVIYKDYHQFDDFQFVIVAENGSQAEAQELLDIMSRTTNTSRWRFVFGTPTQIQELFNSLKTDLSLNENNATERVFIIDKDRTLRGRDDDEDKGMILYGYNTSSIAELKNKMVDDVKVILAEYRLELKKYNTKN